MDIPLDLVVTALAGFFTASSGFLVYLKNRDQAKSAQTRLLMGLAQDKILYLGLKYIDRGYISYEEFDDFSKYLYEPYADLGGNGTTERIMNAVKGLPMRPVPLSKTHVNQITDKDLDD